MSELSITCPQCGAANTIVILGSLGANTPVNCSHCLNPLGPHGKLASGDGGFEGRGRAPDAALFTKMGVRNQIT